MEQLLEHAARRFARDSYFLGYVFTNAGLDDRRISEHLGIPINRVHELSLCRRPRPEPPAALKADVLKIAGHFNVDPHRLLELLREAEVLGALKEAQRQGMMGIPGSLLAARDQEGESKAPPPETLPPEEPPS